MIQSVSIKVTDQILRVAIETDRGAMTWHLGRGQDNLYSMMKSVSDVLDEVVRLTGFESRGEALKLIDRVNVRAIETAFATRGMLG